MSKFKGPFFPSFANPPAPTAIRPMLALPNRALPPGKSWLPHSGARARARALRQKARLELKRLRKETGSTAVVGQEGDALLLDFNQPVRATNDSQQSGS